MKIEGDSSRDDRDDALDALLRQARWEDVTAAEQRLRVWYASRSAFSWRRAAAAAVAVAAVIAIAFVLLRREPHPQDPGGSTVVAQASPGNAPTVAQRLVMRSQPTVVEPARTAVPRILEGLAQGRSASAVAASLRELGSRQYVWKTLSTEVQSDSARAPQIVAVMGELATAGDLPAMIGYLDRAPLRESATPAVVRLSRSAALAALAKRLSDPQFDRAAVAELLRRGNDGTDALLALVKSPVTRDRTLAAIRDTSQVPVVRLASLLGSGDPSTRKAAAMVMGAACHSGSLPVLVGMINRNQHRREAMMGVLSCSEPTAAPYLATIRRDRGLSALLSSVEIEMKENS